MVISYLLYDICYMVSFICYLSEEDTMPPPEDSDDDANYAFPDSPPSSQNHQYIDTGDYVAPVGLLA
jgi:hypothetical protein